MSVARRAALMSASSVLTPLMTNMPPVSPGGTRVGQPCRIRYVQHLHIDENFRATLDDDGHAAAPIRARRCAGRGRA